MLRVRTLMGMAAMVGVCALLLSVGGCGSEPKLPLAPTIGQVTLDGKPLATGQIGFVPDTSKGTTGTMGISPIDSSGHYEIRTSGQTGALIGWHKIRITAIDMTKPDKPWLIPIEYGNPDESGLTAQVKANQPNMINFDLKSRR